MIAKIKVNLIYCYFVSILFQSICLFNIGSFPVTVTFLFSVLLLLVSVIESFINKSIEIKKVAIFFYFLMIIGLSSVFSSGFNVLSILLYLYYLFLFVVSSHEINPVKEKWIIQVFRRILLFASFYAIYQFIAYNIVAELPLKEIIPLSFRTPNYNTVSQTWTFSVNVYRAHSFFVEPSVLSQFSAIAILLTLFFWKKEKFITNFIYIIVSTLSLILSLSGTGFIVLFIGLIYFLFKSNLSFVYKFFFVMIGFFAFVILANSELGEYYFNRFGEVSNAVTDTSGFNRFILPYRISIYTLTNKFFGYGPGLDEIAMEEFFALEKTVSSGYGKVFVELGVLGFVGLVLIFLNLYPFYKHKVPDYYGFFLVLLLILNFVSATIVLDIFWCFAVIINIKEKRVDFFD